MEHCKLQIGCLIMLIYMAYTYVRECRGYKQKMEKTLFDELLSLGIASVILDGVTAYTVNHLETVNPVLNRILHALFLSSLDAVIFVLCLYMLLITGAYPKQKAGRVIIFAPFLVNIVVVLLSIGSLRYEIGSVTNYSMGVSAYTCFIMAAIYLVFTIAAFFRRWNYIESHKRAGIFTYLFVMAVVTGFQMVFPEALITSIAVTVLILGVYMNLEDPAIRQLSCYHSETVMAFANLIENRDDSTGGHVKRTSMYVQLIAEELCDRGLYSNILTKDYITNLIKAAPMHDIGKISVPDAILQKPGKLTDEVARFHHEKWNGKGYPDGLNGKEIPLCARIMAVADVFDAVSEKRCYRDAMPLEKCFGIIEQGSGQDFDPIVAEVFLDIRDKVEAVHHSFVQG